MVRIDDEFQSLCPPLSEDEYQQLEANIIRDGCREPLSVWRGSLLDGHNRYKICKSQGLDFETIEIDLNSREDAINWIIDNQLGRRNLSKEQRRYLRGKRYHQEKKQGARTDLTSNQNDQKLETREKLATELGVSPATIQRDAQYTSAVDTIGERLGEPVKQKILQGKSNLNKQATIAVAESLPPKNEPPDFGESEPETIEGTPINEYAIQAEDGRVLFHKSKINELIADTKKNPGLPAEWTRLTSKVFGFMSTFKSDDVIDSIRKAHKDLKMELVHAERILNFIDDIVARLEKEIDNETTSV